MTIEQLRMAAYAALPVLLVLIGSVSIIREGHVGISVLFGKFCRILRPGLRLRLPWVERVFRVISLQLRSVELEFQAITGDQANVNFKALIVYTVANDRAETIMKAAFKFIDERSFMQTLIRSIEGSIRSFVALKKQSEILLLRREIVDEVNSHIEHELQDWGFHLVNLQINDISFDEAIMRSMAQVVSSNNMMLAAQNEAQAQFATKTRMAEAEAQSRRVIAAADRDAEHLRGEGTGLFHKEVAAGLADAERSLEQNGVSSDHLNYVLWLESMKQVVASSHGNVISFDGSMEGFGKTMLQMNQLGRNGAPTMAGH